MKNFRLQPFEKNNYFYGKLLTVRDFQTEQKYNDDKRWMINRLMFGSGIVTGLKTVMIDDQTVSIEQGAAIDNLGREIVIASSITQKLSLIDGFDNSGYSKNIYLCLEYEEKGKERIQAITNSTDEYNDEISSYNRIQENYKIYLKENISEEDLNKSNAVTFNKTCIFENEKVQIFQITPKYSEPNEEFDIVVEIIKKDVSSKIEFDYTVECKDVSSLANQNNDFIKVDFKEPIDDIRSSYILKYRMTAKCKQKKDAVFFVVINNIKISDEIITKHNDIFINFSITDEKIDTIFKEYNNKSIENIVGYESFETIYLAKIELLKVGTTYLIKSIANSPFNQYVYGSSIIADIIREKNKKSIPKSVECLPEKSSTDFPDEGFVNTKFGEYVFKLDHDMKYPGIIYSQKIIHGLGNVEAFINTAVIAEENFEDVLVSGDVDIFDTSDCKIATVLYPDKGAFVIAVKVKKSFRNNQIRIKWQAIRAD